MEDEVHPAVPEAVQEGGGIVSQPFEYVRTYYKVPAEMGRRVVVNGQPGIIVEDRGHHIGVNFDSDKPGVVKPCHPTWEVEYQGIGKVRRVSRGAARYQRYLAADYFSGSFIDFCHWDARRWS